MNPEPIRAGEQYRTVPDNGLHIEVTRVSRDQSWADILVTETTSGATWRKRQPLRDARFRFDVVRVVS